jgi:hypothetical protein
MKLDPDSSTLIPFVIAFCGASVQGNMRNLVPRRRGEGEARLRRKDRSPRAAHLQTWAEHLPVWHFPPNAHDRDAVSLRGESRPQRHLSECGAALAHQVSSTHFLPRRAAQKPQDTEIVRPFTELERKS